jgi:hypothetical protein
MKICEAYKKMKKENGEVVYLNPMFNPTNDKREAFVVKSKGIGRDIVQVFDSPNTDAVEPIFTYVLNCEGE